jgi:hypothetical protein
MAKGKPERRAKLKAERRRHRPRYMIHVAGPGTIIIDQGKRSDEIDAPFGTVIERPRAAEHTLPEDQEP